MDESVKAVITIAVGKYKEWITQDGLDRIRGYARDGYSDAQIAKNIGISRTYFYEWLKKYPDIADALKKGREPVVVALEDALYKAGLGYEYIETVEEITQVDGEPRKHIKKITKHAPPNVAALIFALKNLKKKKFKDKPIDEVDKADDVLLATLRKWDDAAKEAGEQETN